MANEITAGINLRVKKGTNPPEFFRQIVNKLFDQTGTNRTSGVASIGFAAHEAIPVVDVGTMGWALFYNTSTSNFVNLGIDESGTFHAFGKLLPGEFALIPLFEAPYAQADTAAVDLEYNIFER